MKITNLTVGTYVSRPNRFTVEFKQESNEVELAHLHDPGRLKELLLPKTPLLIKYIDDYKSKKRKTKYDVVGVKNNNVWILLNSSYHNNLVEELINNNKIKDLTNYYVHRREVAYKNSRLDFLLKDGNDNPMYMEVKGCTLLVGDTAIFPDAPTTRGQKHVKELIDIHMNNHSSAILILVLHNNAKYFSPNYDTDPDFSRILQEAFDKNVQIYPLKINTQLKEDTLYLTADKILPIHFKED